MEVIIDRDKSIIPACDVPFKKFEEIVVETRDVEKVGAYKIGFSLGLSEGLHGIVQRVRDYGCKKPIIYDHQKAGTDIPDMGIKFADVLATAEVDAAIIFPQAGPQTEKTWIKALQDRSIKVIVGGIMTHPMYVRSEGGYIADEAIMEMYLISAELNVNNFVVPGNRPEDIKKIREKLEEKGIMPTFYAPGFIKQGGTISETTKVAGDKWHAIIGRAINQAEDIKKAVVKLTSQI